MRYIHAPWHWEMWGDFVQSVRTGTDGYRARYDRNLFDWLAERPAEAVVFDDAAASRILRVCREAMRPGARLLLAEMVIEPGHAPSSANVLDIAMLVLTGGKERTPEEFAGLLQNTGFSFRRVVPTASPFSLVEGVAV